MSELTSKIKPIRAIFFDLHHTITKTRTGFIGLFREAAKAAGIDVTRFSDERLVEANHAADMFLKNYMIENHVDIHWGKEIEDWLEGNRVLIENLGLEDISDEQLMALEKHWKEAILTDWESLVDGGRETLEELHHRGYTLGICTRRADDPVQLLKEWDIHHLLSTIHYTQVPGYAKPSPFTLLKAAEDVGINPRLCAYVGNYVDADIGASVSAEMLPILTVWSDPEEKNLAPEGTIVIDSLTELLDIFKGPSGQNQL
jgi:phosphoglycolate phosphatase-like HAD superfamily hydrolase